MKHLIKLLKWLLILLVVLGAAFLSYVAVKVNKPLTTSGQEKIFTIPAGWTTKQVAEGLEENGFISNNLFFRFYVRFKKQGTKIQAGKYALKSSMSIREIADTLTAGQALSQDVKLTVLEGWNQDDIADALAGLKIGTAPVFSRLKVREFQDKFDFLEDAPVEASLEGYLFPDTYFFDKDSSSTQIAGKMLTNFGRKLTSDLREAISDQGKTVYEVVTLASIIEKEVGRNVKKGEKLSSQELAKLQEERRLVASVFLNRLKLGMALESDATVNYITGSNSPRPTIEETKIDSSYNTYKYRGLPPGPIANPSLDAILAAIEPAETDYLFFVTAPDGTAYFAKTLEEHKANRARYLQ